MRLGRSWIAAPCSGRPPAWECILPAAPAEGHSGHELEFTADQEIPGYFYGERGVFSCAENCTITRTADGEVSTAAILTFDPSRPYASLMAKYADPDADYTYFGYWMKSTEKRDETIDHVIQTFHGGEGDLVAGTGTDGLAAVEGTASYYGAAAGVYVKKDGAGDSLVVTDGTFTADAELTANFGGSAIAADDHNSVTGTISDFMDGSTGTDLGFADLMLEKAMIGVDGSVTETTATALAYGAIRGETNGGGTSGNWSGQFHGNANTGNDTVPTDGPLLTDNYPINVSGEFNGHFANGHVAGAFGAEYDE